LSLLTFKVVEQSYGLPVTTVVRIIEMVTITHLPNAPTIIRGIINLHGKAVPVMDLRQRFGLPVKPYGLHTPIILVDIGNEQVMGLVVDWVEQVQTVPAEDLEIVDMVIPLELLEQMAINAGHLAGIAKVDRQLILILEAPTLLKATEQTELSRALASQNHEPPAQPENKN
jgi:purine-binding chemotaxis protein CheW